LALPGLLLILLLFDLVPLPMVATGFAIGNMDSDYPSKGCTESDLGVKSEEI
jgi:hypothetical protein